MPQKLETILKKVETVTNPINKKLIYEFYGFLQSRDTSINYK